MPGRGVGRSLVRAGKAVSSNRLARIGVGLVPGGSAALSAFDIAEGFMGGGGKVEAGKPVGQGVRGKGKGGAGGRGFFSVGRPGYIGFHDKHGRAKTMRTPSVAHIGKNMPSHRMLTRLRRNLKRLADDAKTVLRVANPGSLAKPKHFRGGFRRGRR